jgi:hypothetical protein
MGRYPNMSTAEELAEEAVIGEPVCAHWFPVPGESAGKFADFGVEIAEAPRLSGEIQLFANRIPSPPKQGKFAGE